MKYYILKKSILLIVLITIFQMYGCRNKYTQNVEIQRAEKIIESSPDSALRILNSLKTKIKPQSADYAAWCLNYTHAKYKLYLDINTDSIIRIAVDFYSKNHIYPYEGISYYLWGCVSEQNNNKKTAMYAYKKADDLLIQSDNIIMKGLINYRIGYLLLLDEYYSESEQYLKKAIYCFNKVPKKKYLYYCHLTKAELLYRQGTINTNVLKESNISKRLALESNDSNFYYKILVFEGKVLLDSNIQEAKKRLLRVFKSKPDISFDIPSLLSFAYSKTNNSDSAKYFSKFINKSDSTIEYKILQELINAYTLHCEGKADSAFSFFENAYNLREKLYKENIKEQLVRIDKQYDLSKKEAEKAQLEIRNQKNVILIAFLSITVLAILLILLIITNINKKRQSELIIEKQQLEFEVKTKQVENEKKLKVLLTNLQNKIDNTLNFKKLQSNFSKTERKEEFIADITRQSTLTDKEWQFYIDEANELFDGKIEKLKLKYPRLTNADMIVISLICIGIDITNSILLLDYSNINTMYIRRNRIKKHLGLDKSVELESWLKINVIGTGK